MAKCILAILEKLNKNSNKSSNFFKSGIICTDASKSTIYQKT